MRKSLMRTIILVCLAAAGALGALMLYNNAAATVTAVVTGRAIPEGAITVVEDFRTVEVSQMMLDSPNQVVIPYHPEVVNDLVGRQAKTNIPAGIPPAPGLFRDPEIVVPDGMRLIRLPVTLVEPSQSLVVGDRVDVYAPEGAGFLTPEVYRRASEQLRWLPAELKAVPVPPDSTLIRIFEEITGEGSIRADIFETFGHCFENQAAFAAAVTLARPEVAVGLEVMRLWTGEDGVEATLMVPVEVFPELIAFSVAGEETGLRMVPVPDNETTGPFDTDDVQRIVSEQAEVFDVFVEDETCWLLWEEGLFVPGP